VKITLDVNQLISAEEMEKEGISVPNDDSNLKKKNIKPKD